MLLVVEHRWVCPNCDTTALTRTRRPHTEFHNCAGLFGLAVPMVEEGVRCKVEAAERADFIASERVQTAPANGRPYMSVTTTRDDGQDCTVYAPCAMGAT